MLPGKKKAFGVAAQGAFQPIGARFCANENEERAGLALFGGLGIVMADGEAGEAIFAVNFHNFGVGSTWILGRVWMRSTR